MLPCPLYQLLVCNGANKPSPALHQATPSALQGCSSVVFFEARKRKDLYLWVAKAPEGPSVKFHVENGEGRPFIAAVTAAMQRTPCCELGTCNLHPLLRDMTDQVLPAVHTMAELKLSGNHLKGSRAVVSFDAGFEAQPHLQLLKEMMTQVFATPRQHQRVKPFFDHVISFHWADNRVWLRNYQVR